MAAGGGGADGVGAGSGWSAEASRLFRVRKTACSMLKARGYNVSEEDLQIEKDTFVDRFGDNPPNKEQMEIAVAHTKDPDDRMFVFFAPGDVSSKEVTKYMERLRDSGGPAGRPRRAILVTGGKFSPQARQGLETIKPDFVIEHFPEDRLLVDITQHELVPQHIPLSAEQKAALLARYKVSDTQLPRMQVADPIAQFYGLERGQVVKIVRPSETAGRYVTYRIVF